MDGRLPCVCFVQEGRLRQNLGGKLSLVPPAGEMAEWLKAAVC